MNELGSRRGRLPQSAEINVTSLVDVAFTLLVIFIITAPILQGGVEVQLPEAPSAPITSEDRVVVSVTAGGEIFIGDIPVTTLEDFEQIFPEYVRQRNATGAYLRGDRDVPYGRVLQVLGLMKELDVVEVGLVAEPLQEE